MRKELSVVCECALPSHFNVKAIITEMAIRCSFYLTFQKVNNNKNKKKKYQSNDHCVKINFLI
jgi:hypothetical protein